MYLFLSFAESYGKYYKKKYNIPFSPVSTICISLECSSTGSSSASIFWNKKMYIKQQKANVYHCSQTTVECKWQVIVLLPRQQLNANDKWLSNCLDLRVWTISLWLLQLWHIVACFKDRVINNYLNSINTTQRPPSMILDRLLSKLSPFLLQCSIQWYRQSMLQSHCFHFR